MNSINILLNKYVHFFEVINLPNIKFKFPTIDHITFVLFLSTLIPVYFLKVSAQYNISTLYLNISLTF